MSRMDENTLPFTSLFIDAQLACGPEGDVLPKDCIVNADILI